ncbi:MAG: prepilin-type N-terminal cleavage/methylation domain-containing protein, partial [Candidatus Magasanikbacteria bacterium]|nr:prepilin-type N-terminal cleavage/methylation domain-containing protein [Candidatus Magasanikbacteria bacterium]
MKSIISYYKKLNAEKGFSLAELIIVLGILTMGLLGIVSLIFQNMQVENLTKNYLIASVLAQEGVEVVRNIRDENWIANPPVDWLLNIPQEAFAVDYRGRSSVNTTPNINGEPGTQLFLNSSNLYSHFSTIRTTGFHRLITVVNEGG